MALSPLAKTSVLKIQAALSPPEFFNRIGSNQTFAAHGGKARSADQAAANSVASNVRLSISHRSEALAGGPPWLPSVVIIEVVGLFRHIAARKVEFIRRATAKRHEPHRQPHLSCLILNRANYIAPQPAALMRGMDINVVEVKMIVACPHDIETNQIIPISNNLRITRVICLEKAFACAVWIKPANGF